MEALPIDEERRLMGVVVDIFEWLTDPANWSGSFGIPTRTAEHLWMSSISVAIAAVLSLPVALYVGHTRRFRFLAVTVANIGRAVPSFAILGITFSFTSGWGAALGFWPTVIALVALAIPPIVTNTYVGIQEVEPDTVEAARGMGQSERQILFGIEIPLAAPLIVTGLRVAAVQVVATASLAALVGWGGLGRFVVDGFAVQNYGRVGGGAVLIALLAILTEVLFTVIERAVAPSTTWRGRHEAPLDAIVVPYRPAGF